jgi:CHASE3 domain sensor protein
VQWRGHTIRGSTSYLEPWRRVTAFAHDIVKQLQKRFPNEDFLDALDIIDPQQWKAARDHDFSESIFLKSSH